MQVRLRVGNAMGTGALLLAETGGQSGKSAAPRPERVRLSRPSVCGVDGGLFDGRSAPSDWPLKLGLFITRFDRRGALNAGDAIVRPDPGCQPWWASDSLVGSQARAARLRGRERRAVAGRLGDPARS